jgi:hypothetical protein
LKDIEKTGGEDEPPSIVDLVLSFMELRLFGVRRSPVSDDEDHDKPAERIIVLLFEHAPLSSRARVRHANCNF